MTELSLIQMSYLTIGPKQKIIIIKIKTENTIASLYHSKVKITQNKGILFSLVWVMDFFIIYSCLGKVKAFSDNSNLAILVDIQSLYKIDI